jgi:hypothetical protein
MDNYLKKHPKDSTTIIPNPTTIAAAVIQTLTAAPAKLDSTPVPMKSITIMPAPTGTPTPPVIKYIECNRPKTWIAISQEVLEEYLGADLEEGYQLTIQGKVFLVNCGTSVKVIDHIQQAVQVQILEGEYKGRVGWTTTTFVRVP